MRQGGLVHKFVHCAGFTREVRTETVDETVEGTYLGRIPPHSGLPVGALGLLTGNIIASVVAAAAEDATEGQGYVVVKLDGYGVRNIPYGLLRGDQPDMEPRTRVTARIGVEIRRVRDFTDGDFSRKVEVPSERRYDLVGIQLSRI